MPDCVQEAARGTVTRLRPSQMTSAAPASVCAWTSSRT